MRYWVRYIWTDGVSGISHDLNYPSCRSQWPDGVPWTHQRFIVMQEEGFGAEPWDSFESQPPLMDETFFLGGVARPRDFSLGIQVAARSPEELAHERQRLNAWFNMKLGVGTLEKRTPGGIRRVIHAIPKPGVQYGLAREELAVQKATIGLRAVDPIWYDPVAKSANLTYALLGMLGTFIYPVLTGVPFLLGSSALNYVATTEFQTSGDWPTFPIFTITGPGAYPVIQNLSLAETVATGVAAAASSGNTLVSTLPVFTAGMVGYTVLNVTDQKVATITTVNSTTSVDLNWTIGDTWDGDSFQLKRDTDAKIALNYTIPAGRTVTIDLRPGYKTITDDLGVSLESYLTDDSAMTTWRLQPDPLAAGGYNWVYVFLGGATVATTLSGTWYDRYSGI